MFLTSLYRGVRLSIIACTLALLASVAFAQSGAQLGQKPVPTAPTGVVATAVTGKVTLSWKPVSGADSYIVYRTRTSGSGYKVIGTPDAPVATDTKVTTGTTYYYLVSAVNAGGESPKTTEVMAMTPIPASPPPAPVNPVGTAVTGLVSLSWSLVPGADSYIIYRSSTSGSGYKLIGTPTGPTGTDHKVTTGTTYYYVVTAVNAKGESPQSAQISVMTPIPATVPLTPANPIATAGNGTVSLTWSLVPGADSYIIYRTTSKGSGYKLIGTPTGPSGTDRKVTNGTTYYYVVTAVNAKGESLKSVEVSAQPR